MEAAKELAIELIRDIDSGSMPMVLNVLRAFLPEGAQSGGVSVQRRKLGLLNGALVRMADDFDETPEGMEEYI